MQKATRVAVIGAGIMGTGIAHAAAVAGYRTSLQDVYEAALSNARQTISDVLDQGQARGKIAEKDVVEARSRLSFTGSLAEAARDADLVIEAVPESIALKIETFQALHRHSAPHAIFASNTSALSITEMASASGRPELFVGMHFFNPVWKMKLVEVIRGLETSPETVALAVEVARRMGKEPVEVKESPGFVTTRLNALIGNEAFYMLQEGVASAEAIDRAAKLGLNHPMGPLELGDLVGWDTRLRILKYLHETLGEKYRPCPLIEQYVHAGRLGKKTGRGVYDYGGIE